MKIEHRSALSAGRDGCDLPASRGPEFGFQVGPVGPDECDLTETAVNRFPKLALGRLNRSDTSTVVMRPRYPEPVHHSGFPIISS